jgi:cytidylate kinase
MYRAVTVRLLEHDLIWATEEVIQPYITDIHIRFGAGKEYGNVFLNDKDVTKAIRSPEVNEHVARISAFLTIRTYLRAQQRELAKK